MVALVAGAGLGLLDTSANQLKGAGTLGDGSLGQAGGASSVNLASGNLVLRFVDESLSGTGADLRHQRTYNSQGNATDGDGDRWRWLGEKRVILQGSLNSAGSTVTRTTGDGHEAVYTWNGSAYQSSTGAGADDTLVRDGNQWVWTEGSSKRTETYNASTGWIKTLRDTSGNGIDYSFTGDRLTRMTDVGSGQTLDLIYNSANRLARLDTSDAPGGASTRQVHYQYDTLGRLSNVVTDLSLDNSIADGDVYTTTYGYDGNSTRVASVSQSDGTRADFTYIQHGGAYKIHTVTDHSGTTTFDYSAGLTEVTNDAGDTHRYIFDSQGRLTRSESPAVNGHVQAVDYEYDAKDNVKRVSDSGGRAIDYTYDNASNLIGEVDSLGNTLTRTYHDNKLVTETSYTTPSLTNPTGAQTSRYVYDGAGRLRFSVSAEGRVTEHRYNSQGQRRETIAYAGGTYDLSGLGTSERLSEAQLTSWVSTQDKSQTALTGFEYDPLGNLAQEIAYGRVNSQGEGVLDETASGTAYVYSEYGQKLQTIQLTITAGSVRESTLSSAVYDGMGRQVSAVSGSGTTSTSYGEGTLTVINATTGLSVITAYDSRGRAISVTSQGDGQSRVIQHYYDEAGRRVMTENAEGGRRFTFYNAVGQVSHEVDAEGAVTEYRYNASGKVEEEILYANTVNTGSWFNGTRVTQSSVSVAAQGADRSTRYVYDDAGRLKRTIEEFGSKDRVSTKQYDGASRVTHSGTEGRESRYFYDADGRRIGVLNAEGYLTEHVYDSAGRRIATKQYSEQLNSVAANDEMADLKARVGSGEVLAQYFFYDSQGRQVGVVDERGFLTEKVYSANGSDQTRRTFTHQYMSPIEVALGDTLTEAKSRAGTDKRTTEERYNAQGQLIHTVGYDGTVSRTLYDNAGRVVREIAAAGTDDEVISRRRYNAFSEVTGRVSGEGAGGSDLDIAIDQYGKRYQYDAMGRKVAQLGPQGQKTFYYYDQNGQQTHTVNALGEVSIREYNSFGQVSTVRVLTNRVSVSGLTGGNLTSTLSNRIDSALSSTDQVVRTAYNQLGLVSQKTGAEEQVTRYGYNRHGDRTDIYRPVGDGGSVREHMDYDKLGRVTHRYADFGTSSTNINALSRQEYDAFGRVERSVNPNLEATLTRYEEGGRRIVVTDPMNRTQTTTYDALGRELSVIDGAGKETTYRYDDQNRATTVTSPEGVSVTVWKTRTGDKLKVQDGNGQTTHYTYNKNGDLKTVTDALGNTTERYYDNSGRLLETQDAKGTIVHFTYDKADRQIEKAVDPTGLNIRTRYGFDGQGRKISVIEGYGSNEQTETRQIFDASGRLTQTVLDPNGLKISTKYAYDDAGQRIRVSRGTVSNPSQQVSEYEFDALGRKTREVLDPGNGKLNIETQYRYDAAGNRTRVIDANGHSTWSVYNAANEKRFEVNALGEVTGYEYDANGQIHHTRQYVNRVSTTNWGDEVTQVNVTDHDLDRRVYKVRDDAGQERFTLTAVEANKWVVTENRLDGNGNVVESRRYDKHLSTFYAELMAENGISQGIVLLGVMGYRDTEWGHETNRLYDTRRSFFAFDAADRLRFAVNAEGHVTETRYDSVGNVTKTINYGDELDSAQLQGVLGNSAEAVAAKLEDVKSGNGTIGANARVVEYRYDRANREVSELSPQVRVTASNGTPYPGRIKTEITYNALGQVTQREEGIIERASGSDILVDRRITRYDYDKAGNQIRTTLPGWYDVSGERVYQTQSGQSDRFQRTVEVKYDALGNAVRNKIRTGLSSYAYEYKAYDAAGRERFSVDALGHVSEKTYDAQGNVESQTRYSDAVRLTSAPSRGYWLANEIATRAANDSDARTIDHIYDAAGRKTHTFLPGANTSYESRKDTTSNPTTADGYLDRAKLAKYSTRPETQYEYNSFGELVLQKERVDRTRWAETHTYYDRIGRQTLSIDPERYATATQYDALGNVTMLREYANAVDGNLSTQTLPDLNSSNADRVQHFTYDAMGRQLTMTRDNVEYVKQQGAGWSSTLRGSRQMSQSEYNAFGEVVKTWDATALEAMPYGNTDPSDASATAYQYNSLGQVVKVTEPTRTVAGTGTDPLRGQTSTRPETQYEYDTFGNVVTTTRSAPRGRGEILTETSAYDHAGNQIRATDAEDNVIRYGVDLNGRVVRQSQAVNVNSSYGLSYQHTIERRFEYDATGRQTTTVDIYADEAKQTGSRQVFNAFGEVVREEKIWGAANTATNNLEDAIVARYVYDDAGRVEYKRGIDGYTFYFYDLKGNVTRQEQRQSYSSMTGARITENYLDLKGRILVQRQPYSTGSQSGARMNPVITQEYDRWGNVVSRTNADGETTTYRYNHRNNVVSETGPQVTVYDQANNGHAAVVTKSIQYDIQGRAAKERHVASYSDSSLSPSVKSSYQLFDRAGNVTRSVDATGKQTNYAYDIHGNKVASRDGVGIVTAFEYNKNGQVTEQAILRRSDEIIRHETRTPYGTTVTTEVNTQSYNGLNGSHEAGKKVLVNGFDYDQAGRKYAAHSPGGNVEYYRYDERGNIVLKKNAANDRTKYAYDAFGNKESEETRMSVLGTERYVYGHTTTSTAQEGSTANYAYRTVQRQDGYKIVDSAYGYSNATAVISERPQEYISGYRTTTTSQRGSTRIMDTREVEYIYGYTTTANEQRGSTAIYDTRTERYQSGTQVVSERPYGSNYTVVHSTRDVEYIDGYRTTTTNQRGSTRIMDTRQVEYVYGYTTTSSSQRGSTPIYDTRTETYQSGTRVVSQRPYGGSYTAVYSTREVEYIDGYRTTSSSQRGSTPIYENRSVEYVYGYTTTSSSQRGSTPIYDTRTERYISHYTSGPYGSTPVYGYRTVEYISGYRTPIYRTRTETVLTGYRTPIYKTREEQYVSGYRIPVYDTRQVEYISAYRTPIYRTRTETYFTGEYRTPIYKTREEEYVSGYRVPVYSNREVEYISGYRTPIYRTETETYFTGEYKTPIYDTRMVEYISGYRVPNMVSVTERYIANYDTPIYRYKNVYEDQWVGDAWTYSKSDYKVGRLEERTSKTVNDSGSITSATYDYDYTNFGQLKREEAASGTAFVAYDYWQNGQLKSKTDRESLPNAGQRTLESTFKYDVSGRRVVERHNTTDTTTRNVYGETFSSNVSSTQTNYYSYDELGRLSQVRSPSGDFQTGSRTRASADLKELNYHYDEWGNRRAIEARYKLPGGSERGTTEMFAYDAEGRTLVADGRIQGGKVVANQNGGTAYTYDGAGRLASTESFSHSSDYGATLHFDVRRNSYNDLGLLTQVREAQINRDKWDTHLDSGYQGSLRTVESYRYDSRGFRTQSVINGAKTITGYRDDGQIEHQTHYNRQGQISSEQKGYQYFNDGSLKRYQLHSYQDGTKDFTNTYNYRYERTYTGRQVSAITVSSTQSGTATGTTYNSYDHRGRLTSSRITESNRAGDETGYSRKYFAYNAEDRMIGSHEWRYGDNDSKTQSYFYHNGNPLADVGDKGINITPINAQHRAGNTPGSHVIQAGQSLSSIAQALYGDGSLWYVLADANGLSQGPTDRFGQSDAGRTLKIPNTNQSLRNDSTAFKPYNPGEAIGDLTPNPEILPPPSGGGSCNVIATIVMVVVAVVVTVFTAGAAAAAIGGAGFSASMGAGAATLGGAALAGGTGTAIAAGFAGGVAGSVASQAAGNAMGVVDGINMRQAFASGLTSAFTFGMGAAASGGDAAANATQSTWQNIGGHMARGAENYVVGQAANAVAGLDTSFSWKGMAAAAAGSALGNGIADGLNHSGVNMNGFWGRAARGALAGSATGKFTKQWAGGADVNYGQIALDAFGNQLGNKVGEGLSSLGQKSQTELDFERRTAALNEKMSEDIDRKARQKAEKTVNEAMGQVIDDIQQKQNADTSERVAAALKGGTARENARIADSQANLLAGYQDVQERMAPKWAQFESNASVFNGQLADIQAGWDDFHAGVRMQAALTSARWDELRSGIGLDMSDSIESQLSYIEWRKPQIAEHVAIYGPRRDVGDTWGQLLDVGKVIAGGGTRFALETATGTAGLTYDALDFAVRGDVNLDGLAWAGSVNAGAKDWVSSFGPGNFTGGWQNDDLQTAFGVATIPFALGAARTGASRQLAGVPNNTATLSTRERVLGNIAESRAARNSSNIDIFHARSVQVESGYNADAWFRGALNQGDVVYSLSPNPNPQFFTNLDALQAGRFDSAGISRAVQVQEHPVFGYRPDVTGYRVIQDFNPLQGRATANPQFGPGGADQFLIQNFEKYLEPITTIDLRR